MPEVSTEQILWFTLNGCFLAVVWLIKTGLTRGLDKLDKRLDDIDKTLQRNHKNYHNLYIWMVRQTGRCNLLHPSEKELEPPEWEE